MLKYLLPFLFIELTLCDLSKEKITSILKFDVSADSVSLGSFEIGLFGETVPKTAENFRALCTGENGTG